jgi:pyruvate dehydrogenase E1 component alpha subunit
VARRRCPSGGPPTRSQRYGAYLREEGALDDGVETIVEEAEAELSEAVEHAESGSEGRPEELFDPVYESADPRLDAQRDRLLADAAEHDPRRLER